MFDGGSISTPDKRSGSMLGKALWGALSFLLCLAAWSAPAAAQGGDRALLYFGDGTIQGFNYAQLRAALVQAGAAGVDNTQTLGNLSSYQVVFLMVPRDGLSAAERTTLRNFYNAGGAIVGVGEHSGFHQQANTALNTLSQELGLSLRIQNGQVDCGCTRIGTVVGNSAVTSGMTTLRYACFSPVRGGQLVIDGVSDDLVRQEDRFVMTADINIFDQACGNHPDNQNVQFFRNLWTAFEQPDPPTVDARGPYTVNEGATTQLQAVGTGDTISFAWDLDNDGQFDDATGATVNFVGDDGTRTATVRVRVTDRINQTATDTATVTINNLNPTITNSVFPDGDESASLAFSGTASDPAGNRDPLTFAWDFGDGNTANGASVNHVYADDGTYTARLTVTDGDGGTATVTDTVSIDNIPPALTGIIGGTTLNEGTTSDWRSTLTKANLDTVNWVISWGDGTPDTTGTEGPGSTSTLIREPHTYTDEGTYTVTFRATDDDGTSAQRTFTVQVRNVAPTITDVSVDPPNGDVDTTFNFSGEASDPGDDGLTFSWDFGDGTPPQTGANVSHNYAQPGTYTATLTVTDEDGATTTETVVVVVTNAPPNIVSVDGDLEGDEGDTFSFEAEAEDTGPLTYTWDFGDGSDPQTGVGLTEVNHVYPESGTYTVTVTVTDQEGASSVETVTVVVNNLPPNITDTTVPDTGFEGSSLSFAAAASDVGGDDLTFTWDFGDGNTATGREVDHTYADNGNYFVTVTVSDGEDEDVSISAVAVANVNPRVDSITGDFQGAEGETFAFNADVSDPGDDTLTYVWNFGDGSEPITGVDEDAVNHVYAASGTYTLSLTVNDEDGGTTTVTRTVNVGGQAPSIVSLEGDTEGLEGSAVSFEALAIEPGNDNITYTWDFGDGSPQQSAVDLTEVTHTYAEDGNYTLTLTATDPDGSAAATLTVAVANVAPQIQEVAAPDTADEGVVIAVAAIATDPAGENDPLSYRWDFGDGSEPVTGQTANHTYLGEGTFVITLTVTDDEGGTSTATREIEVGNVAPDIVEFVGPNEANEARAVTFTALAVDSGADELTYTWLFDDGSDPITGVDATTIEHTWADDGQFTVTLRVSDGVSTTERVQNVTVANLPPSIATLDGDTEGLENTTFAFETVATDPAGDADPLTYTWDFGDGSPQQSAGDLTEVNHLYRDAGLFTLRLTVTDGDGGTATRTLIIEVGNQAPVISALEGDTEGVEAQVLSFEGAASDAAGDELTYRWDFGDNTPVQTGVDLTEVVHAYRDNGTYTVTLTVTDGVDVVSRSLEVEVANVDPEITDFVVPEEGVEGVRFGVEALAVDPAREFDPLTFSWNWGDGTEPTPGRQAEHAYGDNGTFTITLTVTDDDGGEVTQQVQIEVANADPNIAALSGPEEVDEGSEAEFFVVASDVPADTLGFAWTFEDGPSFEGADVTSAAHTYPDDGTFEVTVVVTDEDGGLSTETRELIVRNVAPLITNLTGDFTGSEGESLGFEAEAIDPGADELTYIWNFGDGTEQEPNTEQGVDLTEVDHVYTDAGTYTLSLTVLDSDGGLVTISRTVNIDTAAPSLVEVVIPTTGNEAQSLSFSASAQDPTNQELTYRWDFGDGTDPVEGVDLTEINHTYADNNTYIVTLTVIDPDALTSVATQSVFINNLPPEIDSLEAGFFGESVAGTATASATDPAGDADPLTYTWSWGDGTEADEGVDLVEATHTYTASGTYTLTLIVTDGDGGQDVQTVEIVVGDEPPVITELTGPVEGFEGDTLDYEVEATDPGGDALSYSWQVGDAEPVDTGRVPAFSATFPDNGTFDLTVTVTDSEGQSISRTLEVEIANVAPSIEGLTGRLTGDEGQALDFFAVATDPAEDNDTLTYIWDFGDGSDQSDVDLSNVEHTWADDGTFTITLTVADEDGGAISQTLEVEIANVAPTIVSLPPSIAVLGSEYLYEPEVLDPGADEQTFELLEGPDGMEMDENGVITWSITLEQFNEGGPFAASIRVCDDDGACDEQQWEIVTDFADLDEDGVPDTCEELFGLDPNDPNDANLDPDNDGLTNRQECLEGTDPTVSNGPDAPGIVAPEIGERIATRSPELVISNAVDPDEDVLTYTIEVYADEELTELLATFEDVAEGQDTTSVQTPEDEPLFEENTRYFWRAQAFDPFTGGPFSETGEFLVDEENEAPSIPNLLSPEGSADSLTPDLVLDASEDPEGDAITYIYRVFEDEELAEQVFEGESEETTLPVGVELEEDTLYWWTAAARDDLGAQSDFAEALVFLVNTENALPEAPVIIRPEDGSTVTEGPVEVEWTLAVDAEGDALVYELEIATDENFGEIAFEAGDIPAEDGAETVTEAVEGLEDDKTYFARVRARDQYGPGAFSNVVSFFLNAQNTPPVAPEPISPVDGALVIDDLFEMSFSNATDPDGDPLTYTIEIFSDANLEQRVMVIEDIEEGATGQTVIENSMLGEDPGRYFWRVFATDDEGLDGEFSQTAEFVLVVEITGTVSGNGCGNCATPARPAQSPMWPMALLALGAALVAARRRR